VQLAALDAEANADAVREKIAANGGVETATAASLRTTSSPVWGRLQTAHTSFAATDAAHGAAADLSGFVLGDEWAFGDRWSVGAGGGYSTGRINLDGVDQSSGYKAPRAFGYVARGGVRWTADAGAGLAHNTYDIKRSFAFVARLPDAFGGAPLFGGVSRSAAAVSGGTSSDAWADLGMPTGIGSWMLQPGVGVRFARYGRDGSTETGADALSLTAAADAVRSAQLDLGLRASRRRGLVRPSASVSYRRELTDGRNAETLQLADEPGSASVTNGIPFARSAVALHAGVSLASGRVALTLAYDGREAAGQTRHALQFGMQF